MPQDTGEEGFSVVDRRGRRDAPEPSGEGPSAKFSPASSERSASVRGSPAAGAQQPDLTVLFLMLASSALVYLGKAADPMTGTARPDPAQARFSIDLLRLLREKTEGHRTAEENQLLEDLLYDLQIQFVETVGKASRFES